VGKDWRVAHRRVESEFLKYIGASSPLVLKGGTALMMCYKLNRFSEDLDFDSLKKGFSTVGTVENFCAAHGYSFQLVENTDTVQRGFIHYGGRKPLKVETSYRNCSIGDDEFGIVDGIQVYSIERLAQMKASAYGNRDRIRDLFDLSFIVNTYWDDLSTSTRNSIKDVMLGKGIDQFEYLLQDELDELINVDDLLDSFLNAYEKAGLIAEKSWEKIPERLEKAKSFDIVIEDTEPEVACMSPEEELSMARSVIKANSNNSSASISL
jgi:hypothetical protein